MIIKHSFSQAQYSFLFNFSASRMGGGYKRLHAYAEWFHRNGGAWFIVHPTCSNLMTQFTNNSFFVVEQSHLSRLIADAHYLKDIKKQIGIPDLYYSYGIPIYEKFGKINWFHLTNILPLYSKKIPLKQVDRLKFKLLGKRIKSNLHNPDIFSAESEFSLSHIPIGRDKKVLSVNGSDDELNIDYNQVMQKENIATIIGTIRYKALDDAYHVFQMLEQQYHQELKLIIIGHEDNVAKHFRNNPKIRITGYLNRHQVIDLLKKTKFYISTTLIENSYNAASEGIFFADESIISDIGPHRELLKGMPYEIFELPKSKRSLLHVKRTEIAMNNLKSWDCVIKDIVNHVNLVQKKDN